MVPAEHEEPAAESPGPNRGSRRPPSALALSVVGTAGGLAAVAVAVLAWRANGLDQPALRAGLVDWIIAPYVIGGLVAWRRRPESRFGVLMIVAGLSMAVTTLQWARTPLVYTVGSLLDLLPAIVFPHLFLAFPSGRLDRRAERALIGAGYLAAVGGSLLILLLGGFDPRNLLTVTANPGLAETLQNAQLTALAAISLTGVALLAHRRRAAGQAPRRLVALLVDSFALGLVTFAVLLLAGVFGLPGFEQLRLVTFGVLGLAPVAFLAGLLDARLARSGVAGLLVELRAQPAPPLREALARALRDPTLRLAYWLPQYGEWADEDGNGVPVPDPDPGRATTVIDRDGEHIAALMFDRSLQDERELIQAVSAAADIALENGRLEAELRARLQELHGSRIRVIEAEQRERRRLERDLHDGAQARLVALGLELSALRDRVAADPDAIARVDRVRTQVAVSLEELRDLARGLHPAVLSGHGLSVALESLAARAPVPVSLTLDVEQRLPDAVEVAAYYVVCESLANAGKHASAQAATVDVTHADGFLVVEVSDDGRGGADTERGSGLRGLADRVEALEGRLRVWSPAGAGTRVRAEIPCG
jgi:signal transduction histidine kinase